MIQEGTFFNKKFIVLAIIIGAVLILFSGYFFYRQISEKKERVRPQFSISLNEGRRLLKAGDPQVLLHFQKVFEEAEGIFEKSVVQLDLGLSHLELGNPLDGISLLKELSLNNSYPAFRRATAINYILQYYILHPDIEFGKTHVFSGDRWNTFYDSTLSPYLANERAIRRAYEWSIDIFSTFHAEYYISAWYAAASLRNISQDLKREHISQARFHLEKGDQALNSIITTQRIPAGQLGGGYLMRGITLSYLAWAKGGKGFKDAETEFIRAINTFASDANDVFARQYMPFARLYLAVLFAFSDPPRTVELKGILAELINIRDDQPLFINFINERGNADLYSMDPTRISLLRLAELDPDFKSRLISLGWSTEDFE